MSASGSDPCAQIGDTQRRLVHRMREVLVPVLTEGTWDQIEDDHKKVGLAWRKDLEPGWGKPKYVERVLDDLQDEEVVAVARRAIEYFPDRCKFAVEDALFWIEANGIARISEVTRLGLAKALEGQHLHPTESPSDVLDKFALASGLRFEYTKGDIYAIEIDLFPFFNVGTSRSQKAMKSSHLELLDAYGFRNWPDVRLFRFLEFLVHPTVRQSNEQASLVKVINDVLVADRFELAESEHLSGHPVFKIRPITSGVAGRPKNLIFASTGPKPELGFIDAVNNDIIILSNAEHCLVYDEPIGDAGLPWSRLVEWWATREGLNPSEQQTRNSLGDYLTDTLTLMHTNRTTSALYSRVNFCLVFCSMVSILHHIGGVHQFGAIS